MRRAVSLVVALSALVVLPSATAAAQSAPPGNSGIDQYIEDTPGAGGDQRNPGGGDPAALPERSRATLESDPAGAAALDLAARTAPRGADSSRHGGGDGDGHGGKSGGQSSSESSGGSGPGIGSAVSEITTGDSDGMGLGLPVILVLALVAATAIAVMRRRRQRTPHP
jgi:hypothetical protein